MSKVYRIPVELDGRALECLDGLEALAKLSNSKAVYYVSGPNETLEKADYVTRLLSEFARRSVQLEAELSWTFEMEVKLQRDYFFHRLYGAGRKADALDTLRKYPALLFDGEEVLLTRLKQEVERERADAETPSGGDE